MKCGGCIQRYPMLGRTVCAVRRGFVVRSDDDCHWEGDRVARLCPQLRITPEDLEAALTYKADREMNETVEASREAEIKRGLDRLIGRRGEHGS